MLWPNLTWTWTFDFVPGPSFSIKYFFVLTIVLCNNTVNGCQAGPVSSVSLLHIFEAIEMSGTFCYIFSERQFLERNMSCCELYVYIEVTVTM